MNRHPQPDTAADAPGITSFTDEQLMRVARLFASDESLAAHLDDLPDGGERRRVELASTPHLQMWAISWPAGSTSEWHDHGRATGAFVVVKGALREKRWVRGTTVSAIVEAGESRTFAGDLVHRTAPVGDAPALSVHAYAPSLVGARTYEMVAGSLVEIAA
ncbi:cysteine dioxygenase [Dermacoccus nishinomiyaensis]|uniref:cysteine dioxygenase n=1 Tax=Dermacoccus nishinomiyaensis TaxID=1274 RepID=UPI00248F3945|nr:cysteine dioxygenase family protein [Dermacoccus nishinomiyaensis]